MLLASCDGLVRAATRAGQALGHGKTDRLGETYGRTSCAFSMCGICMFGVHAFLVRQIKASLSGGGQHRAGTLRDKARSIYDLRRGGPPAHLASLCFAGG